MVGLNSAWFESRPGRTKTFQNWKLASVWPSARHNGCSRNSPIRMQSSSESGRGASCPPIGIISAKTKCVRLRKGLSLQHPKKMFTQAIVEDTRRTIIALCSCTAVKWYSQLHCVRTFRRCSRVFAVQFVAFATAWAMYSNFTRQSTFILDVLLPLASCFVSNLYFRRHGSLTPTLVKWLIIIQGSSNLDVSNSNCSEDQIRTYKVTRGQYYDAVATMAVPGPCKKQLLHCISCERYREF